MNSKRSKKIIGRVLAVDDDLDILKLIEMILKNMGYEVVLTASPITALEFLDTMHFDCIITDAIMPHMNGYDLVEAIRRHSNYAKTPIIMLTRKRTPVDVKQALKAGATSYIVKPIDDEVLIQKVNEAINHEETKPRALEVSIDGGLTESELTFDGRITKFSENGFLLLTPVEITDTSPFSLKSKIFEEIGIPVPFLKIVRSTRAGDLIETKLRFVGISEPDQIKIRVWIQNQIVKRGK